MGAGHKGYLSLRLVKLFHQIEEFFFVVIRGHAGQVFEAENHVAEVRAAPIGGVSEGHAKLCHTGGKGHVFAHRREEGRIGHGVRQALTGSAIGFFVSRSEEHTSELQSRINLVCRLLLEKKK